MQRQWGHLARPWQQRQLLVLLSGQAVDRVAEPTAHGWAVRRPLDILLDDHGVEVGCHMPTQGGCAEPVLVDAAWAGDLPAAGHQRWPRFTGCVATLQALQHGIAGDRGVLLAAEVAFVGHAAVGVRGPAGRRIVDPAMRAGVRRGRGLGGPFGSLRGCQARHGQGDQSDN